MDTGSERSVSHSSFGQTNDVSSGVIAYPGVRELIEGPIREVTLSADILPRLPITRTMPSRKRRSFLIAAGGVTATGLAGCSEYVRSTREGGDGTDGSEDGGADAPEPDADPDADPESDPDSDPESEPEPAGLIERTERVMDELRWYRSEYAPNRPRFTDELAKIRNACNALIRAGTGGTDTLTELEAAYNTFSATATTLSTRYPYAGDALEDISDEAERLISAIGVTENPAIQSNLVETARVLRNKTRAHIAEVADNDDVLSADVLSGKPYEYLQSETIRESDTTPVFELRVSLKRNVEGPQSSFFAGAHPIGLRDGLDGDVFRRAAAYEASDRFDSLADYKQPLERFVPFVDLVEFNQEATFSFGKASDGGTYRNITDVSLQVLEHGSERAAAGTVETIIAELNAERQTRIDLDTGEETYDHPIGGHDWTMIRYESWKNDWEEGSDRVWQCLLLTAGRFTFVFDPYPAEEYGEHRWNDLRYTWLWEA
jgi:hypothetical protein